MTLEIIRGLTFRDNSLQRIERKAGEQAIVLQMHIEHSGALGAEALRRRRKLMRNVAFVQLLFDTWSESLFRHLKLQRNMTNAANFNSSIT